MLSLSQKRRRWCSIHCQLSYSETAGSVIISTDLLFHREKGLLLCNLVVEMLAPKSRE